MTKREGIRAYAEGPAPTLEARNFRVDSGGWREGSDPTGVRFLENPLRDAWEILDGPFAGAQYFTFDAAKRETAKAAKRMPTKNDWIRITLSKFEGSRENIRIGAVIPVALGLDLAGFRSVNPGYFRLQGRNGHYWSSDCLTHGWYAVEIAEHQTKPATYSYCAFGLSVRCLSEE